jgi:hypothetical protein
MEDISSMTITTVLALWGAIVSTFLAILRAIDFYEDSSSVKVGVTGGKDQTYNINEGEATKDGLTPDKYVAFASDATGKMYYSHNFVSRLWRLKRFK